MAERRRLRPFADAESLREELREVERSLERAGETEPVSSDAAARLRERVAILTRQRRDLECELEEVERGG